MPRGASFDVACRQLQQQLHTVQALLPIPVFPQLPGPCQCILHAWEVEPTGIPVLLHPTPDGTPLAATVMQGDKAAQLLERAGKLTFNGQPWLDTSSGVYPGMRLSVPRDASVTSASIARTLPRPCRNRSGRILSPAAVGATKPVTQVSSDLQGGSCNVHCVEQQLASAPAARMPISLETSFPRHPCFATMSAVCSERPIEVGTTLEDLLLVLEPLQADRLEVKALSAVTFHSQTVKALSGLQTRQPGLQITELFLFTRMGRSTLPLESQGGL